MNYRFMKMMLITMCWKTSIWGLKGKKIGGMPGREIHGLVGVGSLPKMQQHCLVIWSHSLHSKFFSWHLIIIKCMFSLIYLLSYYCEVCASSLCILNKFVSRALWSFSSHRSPRAFDFSKIKSRSFAQLYRVGLPTFNVLFSLFLDYFC